jgi:hypothetical protein
MKNDATDALIQARQKNINRYCRLLATLLTDHEREYLHRRIAEERLELERLRGDPPSNNAPSMLRACQDWAIAFSANSAVSSPICDAAN